MAVIEPQRALTGDFIPREATQSRQSKYIMAPDALKAECLIVKCNLNVM